MMAWYLALDVGTTSLKAAAISDQGELLATATSRYPTFRPAPNCVEQDPKDWWRAGVNAIAQLLADLTARPSQLRAIGLSGMAATHVLLDDAGQPLRPAILWQDTRAGSEAEELCRRLGTRPWEEYFGIALAPSASQQVARMLWLARNEPEVLQRTRYVLGAKDYLAFRLTGNLMTDRTSSLGFTHLGSGALHEAVAQAAEFDPAKLPPRCNPSDLVGVVTADAAAATGLPQGTPVTSGMIDSWCTMLGAGIASPGDAFDTAGTAEVVGLAAPPSPPHPARDAVYQMPFLTGVDVVYGVTQCGTDALTWLAELLSPERLHDPRVFHDLTQAALPVPAGSEGLLFLPYLEGERSPFSDPRARGGFLGLQRRHHRGHLVRAVLEGVAFSVRHVLEACEQHAGTCASHVVATSGGARSALWNRIKATIVGKPFHTLKVSDAGSVGAAILAAVGISDYSMAEALAAMVHVQDVIVPDGPAIDLYAERYRQYLEAYRATRTLQHQLADSQIRSLG